MHWEHIEGLYKGEYYTQLLQKTFQHYMSSREHITCTVLNYRICRSLKGNLSGTTVPKHFQGCYKKKMKLKFKKQAAVRMFRYSSNTDQASSTLALSRRKIHQEL